MDIINCTRCPLSRETFSSEFYTLQYLNNYNLIQHNNNNNKKIHIGEKKQKTNLHDAQKSADGRLNKQDSQHPLKAFLIKPKSMGAC